MDLIDMTWWFKGIDDPQVFEWQKIISDESNDFDNPKACSDTSIFDDLVIMNTDTDKRIDEKSRLKYSISFSS